MTLLRYIKLKELKDLAIVALTSNMPLVHHLNVDDRHVYFIPCVLTGDAGIVYLYETDKPLPGRYIIYNKLDGTVTVSNTLLDDARFATIAIVEVCEQNILSEKIFAKKKKKGK